jgi:uncharacterized protein (DUF305 family)
MRRTRVTSLLASVVVVLVVALTSVGCTGDSDAAADHNDADLTFVDEMLPHHEQAVAMVEMTEGRTLDPAFSALADQIRGEQEPEIADLKRWQKAWDLRDGSDGSGGSGGSDPDDMDGMEMGGDMAGMMTTAQMTQLSESADSSFERLWLQMMIEHHRGAIAMAGTEATDGTYPPAVEMARSIQQAQAAEITQMQSMLASR